MKHCLAIRWGAFGDLLYALPTLERLKKEYGYLHLESGSRGHVLFQNHPAFDRISVFDVGHFNPKDHHQLAQIRWTALENAYPWDKVVNFWRCLEASCIAEEWQEIFYANREVRRERLGPKNFYDTHLVKAGYEPGSLTDCGTFYFDEETMYWREQWRSKHGGAFTVAMPLCGSTGQKVPLGMKGLARQITHAYPDARIYLMGNKEAEPLQFSFGEKNIVQTAGKWGYQQALAMIQMADYVVGPETSLLVAAGMFGVPKTMMCSSCSPEQATKYHKNDFSIQSTAPCSPCHRAIYNYQGKASERFCKKTETFLGEIPVCNTHWELDPIMKGVELAFQMRGVRREIEKNQEGEGFTSLPDLQPLLLRGADRDEEVRPGVLREV